MAALLPWLQRKWTFTAPAELYPDVIERLRGLPPRVEDLVRRWPRECLVRRERNSWSIQENIGHLLDLEPLLDARIGDFLAGQPTLRAADMSNLATHQARHNDRRIEDLLAALRQERERIVARLESLQPADFARTAEHERLRTTMRLVDACSFCADHDDYHVARMTELARMWQDGRTAAETARRI